MLITTKFNVGDIVYRPSIHQIYKSCEHCGSLLEQPNVYVPNVTQLVINKIEIFIKHDKLTIRYCADETYLPEGEDSLYSSLEEATSVAQEMATEWNQSSADA